jgi:radical SAM/Cys-rich protein
MELSVSLILIYTPKNSNKKITMLDTKPLLEITNFPAITRTKLDLLQVNLGYLCNLSCTHCHVNAGPKRTELMDLDTINQLLALADKYAIKTLDLTGGAPEMNPHFKYLVVEARKRNIHVIDRCNLTVLLEPGYEDMAQFLFDHQVEIVASLPCYSEKNVDAQRGKGVFEHSIDVLQYLNQLGYGMDDKEHPLNLVYNPGGAFLPPGQVELESDYKEKLFNDFGIRFNSLFTITNMPISRFGSMLLSKGIYHDYMDTLKGAYSPSNLETLMCKTLISIDYQGFIYDCDFNQMLEEPLLATDKKKPHISDLLEHKESLEGEPIWIADHCYGCTAGQGSSCGGALS